MGIETLLVIAAIVVMLLVLGVAALVAVLCIVMWKSFIG